MSSKPAEDFVQFLYVRWYHLFTTWMHFLSMQTEVVRLIENILRQFSKCATLSFAINDPCGDIIAHAPYDSGSSGHWQYLPGKSNDEKYLVSWKSLYSDIMSGMSQISASVAPLRGWKSMVVWNFWLRLFWNQMRFCMPWCIGDGYEISHSTKWSCLLITKLPLVN